MVWNVDRKKSFVGDGAFNIIDVPSGRGGKIVHVYGYEAATGVSYSAIYNIKLKIPGGGGPDIDAKLLNRSGSISPYPSLTWEASGGHLVLLVSGSSGGVSNVDIVSGW